MRVGNNPNRSQKVRHIPGVVVAAITHLPNTEGYHAERQNVIKASLETMRANAGRDCGIMIWDNGSCTGFVDWLREVYRPDWLVLSWNMGKSSARASMARMMPSGTVLGVADDDILYYPDWLVKQMKILQTYPNVGTVSGWPVRTQFRFHTSATVQWGKKEGRAKIEHGRFISDEEEKDFCRSIGRDWKWHKNYSVNDEDIRLTFKGVQAYATGHHCQWIGYVDRLKDLVLFDNEAMADERIFERAINDAGLLRLTTCERTTRHIGNVLEYKVEEVWQNTERNSYISAVANSCMECLPKT